jgi:hypothetical protein
MGTTGREGDVVGLDSSQATVNSPRRHAPGQHRHSGSSTEHGTSDQQQCSLGHGTICEMAIERGRAWSPPNRWWSPYHLVRGQDRSPGARFPGACAEFPDRFGWEATS